MDNQKHMCELTGSIVDISHLQCMLEMAKGYGYKRVEFILDRGYFGKENIQYMDQCGYDFVLMIKGMLYTLLKDEMEMLEKSSNYMSVLAAIRELEKIEMVRQADGIYRMDRA